MSKEDIMNRSWQSKLVPPTYDASYYFSSHEAFEPLSDQERTDVLRPAADVQWVPASIQPPGEEGGGNRRLQGGGQS